MKKGFINLDTEMLLEGNVFLKLCLRGNTMKMRESLQGQIINVELEKHFNQLSANMLELYKTHGESTECIHAIQDEIKKFYYSRLREQSTFYKIIKPYANKIREKAVYRIVDDENFMVALHLTPKGIKFPIHSHPYTLNSLLVVKGALKVEQYNFVDMMPESKHKVLHAGSCSVGLQKKYNTHALETITPFNVFFSIRCKVPKPEAHQSRQARQFRLPKLFALGFSLFASLSCYATQQANVITLLTTTTSFNHTSHRAVGSVTTLVKRANKLRQKDEESQYDAAQLYQVAANKNNAEAQYWLGYMHLMGMGITEDNDEALDWIAVSANQGYPPAEKMLDYLLNAESEYDC